MRVWRALILGLLAVVCSNRVFAQAAPPNHSGAPTWAADAIWYSIVVDRFRNADPRNDPKPSDLRGAFPGDAGRDWQVAPWTGAWYTLLPWERASGRDFYTAVHTRRYGGDLAGVIEKLEHLGALGVNVLLLSPVFEAPSAMKRDPSFLHHVDNNLGPEPDTDRLVWATENPSDSATWKWSAADRLFLRLVQECHRRQMKVVLEVPVAFVGQTFWAFRDVRAKGAASKYAAWFAVGAFDDPRSPGDEFEYAGFQGAREMPEFKKEGEGVVPRPLEHVKTVLKRWSDPGGDGDPSDGVDGFLFPGVERLGPVFWRDLRRYVHGLNAEAIVVGGLGFEDEARTRPVDPTSWLARDSFDVTFNHAFTAAGRAFFLDKKAPIPASALDSLLSRIRSLGSPERAIDLPSPLDGQDGERAASRAVNPDREAGATGSPRDNPAYDLRAPRPEEWKRLRLLAALQFSSPGAPLLTYGTEAGLWGAAEPDSWRPMVWREMRFEDDSGQPSGQGRKGDPVRFDEELFAFFQTLGRLRAAQPALRRGTVETLLADDSRRLYAFHRVLGEDRVTAAFNLEARDQALEVPFSGDQARELLSARRLRARDGKLTLALAPLSAAIVVAEPSGQ
jgi:cyclomaltodextrinase / maltogenic alpha-amylase / neopullulanase